MGSHNQFTPKDELLITDRGTYQSFRAAWARCNNPKNNRYYAYGARGIKFKFTKTQDLIDVIGIRPMGYSLDRIDNNGHYEPGNVRWLPKNLQSRSRRINKLNLTKARQIRQLFTAGWTRYQLAEKFNTVHSNIAKIISLQYWRERA
jgi:hypothetical protein